MFALQLPMPYIHLMDTCHKDDSTSFLVLSWPPKSPDMNSIENVWHLLKAKVRKRFPKDLNDLENIIKEEWNNLNGEIIGNIASSFKCRIITLHNRKCNSLI